MDTGKVWTADELFAMTPNERHAVVQASIVTDIDEVPGELLTQARSDIRRHITDVSPGADAPRWSRVEEKSLAIHRRIAARLLEDPEPTLTKARHNLDRLREADRGHAAHWLDDWNALLDRPTDEIVTAMLDRTQHAIDLRQMTPFAGVITDAERIKALQPVKPSDSAETTE